MKIKDHVCKISNKTCETVKGAEGKHCHTMFVYIQESLSNRHALALFNGFLLIIFVRLMLNVRRWFQQGIALLLHVVFDAITIIVLARK